MMWVRVRMQRQCGQLLTLESVGMQATGRGKSASEADASGKGAGAAGAPAESPLPLQQSKRRKRELRAAARSGGKGTHGEGNIAAQVPGSAGQASPKPVQRQRPREDARSQQAAKQTPLAKQKKRLQTEGDFLAS